MRHAMKKDTGVRLGVLDTVVIEEDVRTLRERDTAAKPEVIRRQMSLLYERYDLSNRPASGVIDAVGISCASISSG